MTSSSTSRCSVRFNRIPSKIEHKNADERRKQLRRGIGRGRRRGRKERGNGRDVMRGGSGKRKMGKKRMKKSRMMRGKRSGKILRRRKRRG